jgi:hypothetical protein
MRAHSQGRPNGAVLARALAVLALTVALIASLTAPATGHEERDAHFPDGEHGRPEYRDPLPDRYVVVCKPDSADEPFTDRFEAHRDALLERCSDPEANADPHALEDPDATVDPGDGFLHIQAAVNYIRFHADEDGWTIYILPGTYLEEPTRSRPDCADEVEDDPEGGNDGGVGILDDIGTLDPEEGGRGEPLSYEQQLECPYAQNLIVVFGQDEDHAEDDGDVSCKNTLCDLQIEGTGETADDVVIRGGFFEEGDGNDGTDEDYEEGRFLKLNGLRVDRADGVYTRNFTTELFEFNAVYILEVDGFVVRDAVTRYNDEYGWLTFAVDNGLYMDCEGYGNGDSAIYPGSASDRYEGEEALLRDLERPVVEITRCKSWGNAVGYSGTAGNAVYVHDNDFFGNQTGVSMDSVFPDHPGMPQSHAWFENNRIYNNNANYYEDYVDTGVCDRPYKDRGYEDGTVCPIVPMPVGTGVMVAGGNWNLFNDNEVWNNWRTAFKLFSAPAFVREEPLEGADTSHYNHYVGNALGFMPSADRPNGLDFWWDDQGEGNCWEDNESVHGEPTHNSHHPAALYTCEEGGSPGQPVGSPDKVAEVAPCATYDREDNPRPPGCDWMNTPDRPARDEGPRDPHVSEVCPAPDGHAEGDGDFDDVTGDEEHGPNISCIGEYGIAQGYEDGSYRPGVDINRAQMASFIADFVRTAGAALESPEGDRFGDIADVFERHRSNINALAAAAIVLGVTEDEYRPRTDVTRAQMASFIADAIDHAHNGRLDGSAWSGIHDDRDHFDDIDGITERHRRNINRLAAVNVVVGRADGDYHPADEVSRGAMASFIMRSADYLHEHGVWEPASDGRRTGPR